ncbi:MAG: D-alanyl-D-alanine carboxypeptidase [Bdellovibrionales bacterium]
MFLLAMAVVVSPAEAARKKKRAAPVPKYAALVIDATSGRVLHQENANAQRHPASLTKMMTLYMVFAALERGQLSLNQRMYVSSIAAAQPPSKLGLRTGNRLRVEDAILGLVTQSANDAAVVLAEELGGSEARFAVMMTETARKLGMNSTVFKNASGLPNKQQVTTARDMAKLGLALLRHYPQYYPYFSTAGFNYEGGYHNNHNRLMSRYSGMDGIKTGFISASGFNLVASAMRDGRRLVGVVFGGRSSATRDNQMAKLLDAAFEKAKEEDQTEVASLDVKAAPPAKFMAPMPQRKPEMMLASADTTSNGMMVQSEAAEARAMAVAAVMQDNSLAAQPAILSQGDAQDIGDVLPKSGWGIQIGAYNDRPSSQRALAIVADQYSDILRRATTRVIAVDTPSGTIYRARLVGIDQDTAAKACARLQRANHSCLTLPPAGAPAAWLASAQ